MISCSPESSGRRISLTFTVTDPRRGGQQINLVGDFNDWDRAATKMHGATGAPAATVALETGRYRFRYLGSRDGWFNDEDAGCYEFNEFGEKNCVLDLAVLDLAALRRRAKELQDAC
ncbi:MAG TPA: isoamylase early set domain-containing protein [Sporichthyaceae bacterium]|jgi:hypothetical protein|nr:isoamylase early set domain-containing protein [Sporichthyaceae bacterium]